jgi:hypothetical protein
MDIKKSLKINYKLGSNYLLFPTHDGWVLMRSGSYRPIMNSNDNTDEQLDKFVKEHREYNALTILTRYTIIANLIILGLCVLNLFKHSTTLSYFCWGALMVLLPMLILINYMIVENKKVYHKVLNEDQIYYAKLLAETNKKERKSTRLKKGEKRSSEVQK